MSTEKNSTKREARKLLNDAYQYGLEAQGHFDPGLANAALGLINDQLMALIVQERAEAAREARVAELRTLQGELWTDAGVMDTDDVDSYATQRLAALTTDTTKGAKE